jgi:acetyltransferase
MRDPAPLAGGELALAAQLVQQSSATTLGEQAAKAVLVAAGIPICREIEAATPDDAMRAAEQIGYPVALKINSPDILHKTEAGCVQLSLDSTQAVAEAYQAIVDRAVRYRPDARIDGVLVQEMVLGGAETFVGITNYAGLGPMLVFGLGGIFVEMLDDWAMRAAPITEPEARAMIAETRAARILAGWRGGPPLDVAALAQVLVQVSQLAWQLRDTVAAIDINPLVVLPLGQGIKVVDALIVRQAAPAR